MAEVELRQLGPYTLGELLYTRSASHFYRGQRRKKELLIKRLTIPLTRNEDKEAFLARCRQLKKLKDRHIVNILDANFDGDYGYLVMEAVHGETLRQRLTPGEQLAPDHVKRLLSPLASALHYAHLNNVYHGNLHPGNILSTSGSNPLPLLMEFALTPAGFTPVLDDEENATPYMAPEQLRGEVSAASDQYALATMVYEWLCGRRPYEATERELLQQQQRTPCPPPSSLNSDVSPAVERVVLQALSYEPGERFPHTQVFADHYLSALMGFAVKTPTPPLRPPARKTSALSAPAATEVDEPLPAVENSVPRIAETPTLPLATVSTPVSIPETPVLARKNAPARQFQEHETAYEPHTTPEFDDLEENEEPGRADGPLQSVVAADLHQGGILSHSLPGYEERPAQIQMASMVARAITESAPAIIEAGTGTGKSLAYLVPIVRSGEVAIVSTANKALQEQLFYKDIPFVQKYIKHFEAALVKGMGNYVCLDRVENERTGMQFFTKNRDFTRLLDLTNDADAPFNGDFETLGFQLSGEIRGRVAADSDQCAWSKCEFFSECYVRKMRERAQRAQIIVVNHTLLLLDAAMDGFLLPERDLIVLDEAHHLEEEATRSFTTTIGPAQIQTLLQQRILKDHSLLSLQDEASRAAQQLWMSIERLTDFGYKGRVNLEMPLEEGLRLATVITDLADSLRKQRPKNLEEKEGQLYDKLLKRTQNLAENIRTVFAVAQREKYVYYIERVEGSSTRGFIHQASAAPLDVTSWLKEKLFEKSNVVCTSATLATVGPNPARPQEKGPNFGYFRRRVGLDAQERSDVLELILPLAFDYEKNALLYVPRHLPEPTFGSNSDEYMKAIAREMYRLVKLSRGRAFLLFSSKRMLDRAFELMAPHLPYPLLKQGDMTRLELTRRFRQEEGAVLFGLKSFWEGVDIAGDALSLVVIDKLPFDPPDDPVHEARVAHMKAAGENWFGTYVLPQAVLRLKQGIGRLLRTHSDRGVMAILDTRLHTKGYGKQVLQALPPAYRSTNIRDVEAFFALDQNAE